MEHSPGDPSARARFDHPPHASDAGEPAPTRLASLASTLTTLERELLADEHRDTAPQGVVRSAVGLVQGADWASITLLTQGRFSTPAATHPEALASDLLQYELQSGPCVDAILDDTLYRAADMRADDRWPTYGPRVANEHGVNSMLSYRLHLDQDTAIAGLNLYSTRLDAFDDDDVSTGLMLATIASFAMTAALARMEVAQLRDALERSREIGRAIGIVMSRHNLTREQAFNVLRMVSQDSNRKLHDVAVDVVDTGSIELRQGRMVHRQLTGLVDEG
jgi:GAF domain-containing protein